MKALTSKISQVNHLFKCNECDNEFTSKHTLKRHSKEQHEHDIVGMHSCPENECKYTTDHEAQLKKHITLYHSKGENILCDHCPFTCYSESGMKKHFGSVHDVANKTCHVCKQIFSSKAKMKVHVFNAHKKGKEAENIQLEIQPTSMFVVKRMLGQHAQYSVLGAGSGDMSSVDKGSGDMSSVDKGSVDDDRMYKKNRDCVPILSCLI